MQAIVASRSGREVVGAAMGCHIGCTLFKGVSDKGCPRLLDRPTGAVLVTRSVTAEGGSASYGLSGVPNCSCLHSRVEEIMLNMKSLNVLANSCQLVFDKSSFHSSLLW